MHSSYSKVTMAWHGMTGWHNASSMTQHIIQSRPMFVYILPAAHCLGLLPSMCMMQVTHNVACLARWMAADLYLREVDVLRFEVTIYHNLALHILTDLMLDTMSVVCQCSASHCSWALILCSILCIKILPFCNLPLNGLHLLMAIRMHRIHLFSQ